MSLGVNLFLKKDSNLEYEIDKETKKHRKKGKNLFDFPPEYIVIDIETTGLSPEYDDIIELSAIKIINGEEKEHFSSLVRPDEATLLDDDGNCIYVDEFITELTGITNEMLKDAPATDKVLSQFLDFVGDNILVGHNTNFDINFLYDNCKFLYNKEFNNDFCDLLRISRRLFPDLKNHKLSTLAEEFGVETPAHRGLNDCISTYQCFEHCRNYVINNNINIKPFNTKNNRIDLRAITSNNADTDINTSHPLYGKTCVFTGKLELFERVKAAQIVVNLGGICGNNVTKDTDFLILGNNDYCSTIKNGKSSKQKKAEKLILSGQDLKIIPEDVFYDMVLEV